MIIRLANHGDIRATSNLYTEFFSYNANKQPKYYLHAIESGEYPASVIHDTRGDLIVAEADKVIVGFVHVEEDETPPFPSVSSHKFACIVDFFVTPQHRKTGIGHMLLKEVKQWGSLRNLEYIELMVLENNDTGISFYEQESFSTVSRTMRLDL